MNPIHTLQQLARNLAEYGEHPAIVALSREDRETWDYNQLSRESEAFAAGLFNHGLQSGDHIAIIAGNQPAWFAACLGILRAGGVAVPIDVQLSDDVLAGVLDDCRPARLITTADNVERIEALDLEHAPDLILLDGDEEDERHWQQIAVHKQEDAPDVDPGAHAVIFYTSGTTGPPKGVPLTHANLVYQLNELAAFELIVPEDRVLLPLPLHHVYPFSIGMLLPFYFGIPIVLPASLTGPQIVRALNEAQVSAVIGVPRLYRALYDGIQGRIQSAGWLARPALSTMMHLSMTLRRRLGVRWGKWLLRPIHQRFGPHLRILASGGSPLDPDLAYRLEGLGWPIAIGYGLTETSPLLTVNPPGEARIGSVGFTIGEIEIRIDPTARPGADEEEETGGKPGNAGTKEEGEIQARGPNVFSGYLNMPEKTEESFTEDGFFFKTGDLGRFDEDGYLYVTGRVSTLIVTEGGENIQPDQVEEAYSQHSFIREVGVLQRDSKLVAVIVPELGEVQRQSQGDIHEVVRRAIEERSRKLPSYQRLADFVISRESLARTRLGKIQRHKLEEHYDRARRGEAGEEAEEKHPIAISEMSDEDQAILEDPAARRTWDWLAERYHDRRLTPNTSPQLDLGIDSLEWLNISLEIRQRTGVELTESAISGIESIRDLLEAVAEQSEGVEVGEQAQPLEDPESVLSDEQFDWFKPLGPGMRLLGRIFYGINWLLLRLYFRLRVEGKENLPDDGQYIIAPNHLSFVDPLAVAATIGFERLNRLHWAGAAQIMLANPFMRLVTRLARVVPVDPERAAISSLALGAAVLKRKKNLIWFPEGMRSRSGELQRFQPGIGLLVDRFDVPVVPVWIEGSYEALAPGQFWPRPRQIRLRIGQPLQPEALRERGEGDKPHQRITQGLRRHMLELGGKD